MIGKTMDESFIGLEGTSPFQTLDLIHSSRFENIVKALTGQCEWKQVIDGDDELKQRLVTQGIENQQPLPLIQRKHTAP